MSISDRWKSTNRPHGVTEIELSCWDDFFDYVREYMLDYDEYVWRGQRCST